MFKATHTRHASWHVVDFNDQKTGRLRSTPEIETRGFVTLRDADSLLAQARTRVGEVVAAALEPLVVTAAVADAVARVPIGNPFGAVEFYNS